MPKLRVAIAEVQVIKASQSGAFQVNQSNVEMFDQSFRGRAQTCMLMVGFRIGGAAKHKRYLKKIMENNVKTQGSISVLYLAK